MSQVPEKPLTISVGGRIEKPQKVYFFERADGSIFPTNAVEAWALLKRPVQIIGVERVRHKLIGTGDGVIFHKAIMESQEIGKTDIAAAQARLKQGELEELEACRGKIVYPPDADKMGDGANYI